VTSLKQVIIQDKETVKICMMGFVAITAVLLAFLSIPSQVPGHVSAQIIPSTTLDSSGPGIGFMTEDSAATVQNSTSANITQLATISQPITPASFTPVSEEPVDDESDDSTSSTDDDKSDGNSGDDDDDDSEDNGDDDGDGGGNSASAGGGGAFASAG
jgi:hypothetical protein